MKRATIKLNNIEAVKRFAEIAAGYGEEIDLLSGRYLINAKSMLGILSLDLNDVISMQIHGEHPDDVMAQMEEFIVEE